jgi:hypothetical protein
MSGASQMQTIMCMKWGTRYSANYVNCLWAMIKRNTARPTRLVCYTDDPTGVDPEVTTLPMLEMPLPARVARNTWRKLALWAPEVPGVSGDILFLDLDMVVTGSLDELFDYEPNSTFCVIENWTQMGSGIGNTSCFRFRVGAHPYIYDRMCRDPEGVLGAHRTEQAYISRVITEMHYWPASWCVSFKHTLLPRWPLNLFQPAPLPKDTKIVAFTGKPDPDEARDGRWPAPWYKKIYKVVRPTPWIAEHWRPA